MPLDAASLSALDVTSWAGGHRAVSWRILLLCDTLLQEMSDIHCPESPSSPLHQALTDCLLVNSLGQPNAFKYPPQPHHTNVELLIENCVLEIRLT